MWIIVARGIAANFKALRPEKSREIDAALAECESKLARSLLPLFQERDRNRV